MMKKISLLLVCLLTVSVSLTSLNSCGTMLGGNTEGTVQSVGRVANIASVAAQIASILGGRMGFTGNQESLVTNIFSDYIRGINNIASLAGSNANSYAKKLRPLNNGTLKQLGKVLTSIQFSKLTKLKGDNNPTL